MRELTGQTLGLAHHPFPKDKARKEYVIGEALLRWKGIPADEIANLSNVASDPPDLAFETVDFGKIRMEITESVPYDRSSEAQSVSFVQKLKAQLKELGTRPPRLSNIFISREPFAFPSMGPKEIKTIARQIDSFFKTEDFEAKYEVIDEIVTSPIKITFRPALGTFAHPPEFYNDNLFLRDITAYPIESKELERSLKAIIKKKRRSESAADILIIFHGTIGIVSLKDGLIDGAMDRLTSTLAYKGIYIVEIIQFPSDYWVHVITVREHPLFERKSV